MRAYYLKAQKNKSGTLRPQSPNGEFDKQGNYKVNTMMKDYQQNNGLLASNGSLVGPSAAHGFELSRNQPKFTSRHASSGRFGGSQIHHVRTSLAHSPLKNMKRASAGGSTIESGQKNLEPDLLENISLKMTAKQSSPSRTKESLRRHQLREHILETHKTDMNSRKEINL